MNNTTDSVGCMYGGFCREFIASLGASFHHLFSHQIWFFRGYILPPLMTRSKLSLLTGQTGVSIRNMRPARFCVLVNNSPYPWDDHPRENEEHIYSFLRLTLYPPSPRTETISLSSQPVKHATYIHTYIPLRKLQSYQTSTYLAHDYEKDSSFRRHSRHTRLAP